MDSPTIFRNGNASLRSEVKYGESIDIDYVHSNLDTPFKNNSHTSSINHF